MDFGLWHIDARMVSFWKRLASKMTDIIVGAIIKGREWQFAYGALRLTSDGKIVPNREMRRKEKKGK